MISNAPLKSHGIQLKINKEIKLDPKIIIESIDHISNQICEAIDGNFDIYIEPKYNLSSIDKLVMMINFLLNTVRDSIEERESDYATLQQEIENVLKVTRGIAKRDFSLKANNIGSNTILNELADGINDLSDSIKTTTISRDYFTNIYESLPTALLVCNENYQIKHANRAACTLLEYTIDELLALNLDKVVDTNISRHPYFLSSAIKNEQPTENPSLETEIRNRQNKLITVLMSKTELKSPADGHEILFIFQDVSIIKQAEMEKDKAYQQLHQAQKLESVGTLAAGVAHDFNNILNSALGYLELLHESTKDNSTEKSYLEKIEAALESAASLVKSLLGFSRKGKIEEKPININKLIEDSINLLARTVGKTTDICLEIDNTIPQIKGDNAQLMQVILNLCINAHQAMNSMGKITIATTQIEISDKEINQYNNSLAVGSYVQILVSDNGPGISQENVNKIFDPFFTTKSVGEGSGLGLSSSYGIIKNHHGYLSLAKTSNEGTCFSIILPATTTQIDIKDKSHSNNGPLSGVTILIVDDEEMLRLLNKEVLEKEGAKIYTAENGQQGLEIYQQHHQQIDLVLLDVMMPVMCGDQCLIEMKKISPNIKAIICSGYAEDETLSKIHNELTDNIIVTTKPIRPSKLKERISDLVGSKR